ncbi:carboxylesterase [Pyrenophora seminiperda CCB06]|uniref:Carboxylesterase n=1 Tax=Pyrenophora seminiperda CCB06 TaxID=1302712 RepID=A0A3M7LX17_9PLEO|nr:carboxylesterase [Pyrenophora seminiperda CCB06]
MSTNEEGVLKHATLNRYIRGSRASPSTVQFRNLKYASIPARFKDSVPDDTLNPPGLDNVVDATQFGPSCPHVRGSQAWDLTLIGNAVLPCEYGQGETEKMDEFECLHVNVTVPRTALDAGGGKKGTLGLPVFVWVHGGGLSMGSNSWPQYDLRRFVERSVEIDKPIIGVSINYRLNIFGFLASEEIGADGNMGFKDQVLAFQWIKKHIAGFGGDPTNIIAAGESAGAISLSTLLCANVGDEGLFNSVVLMSGEATLRKWRNRWWHQKMYEDQSQYLKLDPNDSEGRRKALLDSDAEELAQKLPLAQHFCATMDGQFLTQDVTIEALMSGSSAVHNPSWCKEFVMGDTAHDGLVLKARVLDQPECSERLQKACNMHLSHSQTQELVSAYGLDRPLRKEDEAARLLELVSELRFYLPVLEAHQSWRSCSPPKRASRYHFHVPNPMDGPFKGLASHELDVAYLLYNYVDHFDEHDRMIAKTMQDQFLGFINGEGWAKDGKMVVFGYDGAVEVDEEKYDEMYRKGRGAVLEKIGIQKLWCVAETWQGVRQEEEEQLRLPGDSKL